MSKIVWLNLPHLELSDVNKMFKILGYSSYTVFEIYKNKEVEDWKNILLQKQKIDFSLLDKYDVLFPPASYYYREILQEYPDAKFIVEDNEHIDVYKRYKKLSNLIRFMGWTKLFKRTRAFLYFIQIYMRIGYANKSSSLDIQVLHKDLIYDYQKNIPSRQLLLFSSANGWEELCGFLRKEIPKEEFPLKETKSTITSTNFGILTSSINNNLIAVLIYFLVLISIFTYLIFFY